ncbi:TetR family transcriptional regulator [Enterococcus florum]|uniref:TetR family transcriptional regulator n=1 Tax=Enterococcus florum TaxID=2480627 RepID=A0A4P5P5S9_9ENTE|nr:TetR/AcrR family transcriptional regulator [Enterococcus florum]GCF93217.1 TetR family transcriptional regulator [Enterococcus florum]
MRVVKEHETRRTEIIDTAEEFFLTKGYEKTTINDILKKIGIAKGTFYHYFKSKEEVMDAVIMRVVDQDRSIAQEVLKTDLGSLEKVLLFLNKQSAAGNQRKSEMLEQFHQTENALMKQRALEGTLKYVCPVLAQMIEEGNQTGEFSTEYPLESIQFLIAGIQSLSDERMLEDDPEMIQRKLISFVEFIFRILGINEEMTNKQITTEQLIQVFIN